MTKVKYVAGNKYANGVSWDWYEIMDKEHKQILMPQNMRAAVGTRKSKSC